LKRPLVQAVAPVVFVARRARAWIETRLRQVEAADRVVARRARAWIETTSEIL